jgi:hypothetical protein
MEPSAKVVWAGRIVTALASLAFLASGVMKVVGGADVTQGMAHLGLPASMRVPLAILEIACAVVYLIPATSVVGAILLAGYMGGAMLTHWRMGEPIFIQIALALLVWLGIYLREPRLKALIPVRRPVDAPWRDAAGPRA